MIDFAAWLGGLSLGAGLMFFAIGQINWRTSTKTLERALAARREAIAERERVDDLIGKATLEEIIAGKRPWSTDTSGGANSIVVSEGSERSEG